jgi:hypothetical protein
LPKLEKGPAPKRMAEIKSQMIESRELGLQELPLVPWHRTVNLRRPNLTVFKPEHIAVVDNLIEKCANLDGNMMSEVSHRMPCWIIPDLQETIPYESVFLSREELTDADVERGVAVAKELGLLVQNA